MKPLKTPTKQLDDKYENCKKIYLCVSVTFIVTVLCVVLGFGIIDIVCKYDNIYKYESMYSIINNEEINNIKTTSTYMTICFNSSNPESYKSITKQLDEVFEYNYCYPADVFKEFKLICTEYNSEFKFDHYVIIDSSKITEYQEYCLRTSHYDYGYGQSLPCVVFTYFAGENIRENQIFYKFPIQISVKDNFYRSIMCKLFHLESNSMLTKFHLTISNGKKCHTFSPQQKH